VHVSLDGSVHDDEEIDDDVSGSDCHLLSEGDLEDAAATAGRVQQLRTLAAAARTEAGALQLRCQAAVLSNNPLQLHVLAEAVGGGALPGMVASNLLALALVEGCTEATLAAVLKCGGDANSFVVLKNASGEPARIVLPLVFAAERGSVGAVRALLAAGADPRRGDTRGRSALSESAKDAGGGSDAGQIRALLNAAAAVVVHDVPEGGGPAPVVTAVNPTARPPRAQAHGLTGVGIVQLQTTPLYTFNGIGVSVGGATATRQ
jgi:hypothetical protein